MVSIGSALGDLLVEGAELEHVLAMKLELRAHQVGEELLEAERAGGAASGPNPPVRVDPTLCRQGSEADCLPLLVVAHGSDRGENRDAMPLDADANDAHHQAPALGHQATADGTSSSSSSSARS